MFGPGARARTAPSQYPRVPFHGVRLVQLISSIVVGAVMIYFMRHLADAEYPMPWTFIFLLASSLFSVAALAFTMVMHCCVGLNPRLNLLINGSLSCLWGASWAVLTWYMSGTLAHVCNVDYWHDETGIMVCRVYKALFTFALLGFLSTVGAFALDVYVRRRQTRSGIYRLHDIDGTHIRTASEKRFPTGLQFTPSNNSSRVNHDYAQPEGQYRYDTAYQAGHVQ